LPHASVVAQPFYGSVLRLVFYRSHLPDALVMSVGAVYDPPAQLPRQKENRMSKKAAEHHHQAAEHHEHAARHHREAARHHEAGDHETAAHHAHTAQGHLHHATHHSTEAAKQHAEHYGHKAKAAGV
jgi:hypothetical protein